MKKLVGFVWLLLVLSACQQQDYRTLTANPLLYARTVKKLNNVVMENNFPPIIASRNYLYASIAAYEVIAAGNPEKYRSLGGQLNDLPLLPKLETGNEIDFPFAAILAFCKLGESVTFPEGSMQRYVDSLKKSVQQHGMPAETFRQTQSFADTIGKIILAWSKKDNYAQTRTAPKYAVLNSPGRWVPTPPLYSQALEPHWNEIRPLVLDSADELVPPRPVPFNMTDKKSAYYQEVMRVKNIGDSLTDEQKHIAEFWDDLSTRMNVTGHVMFVTKKFSPPGHWMNIVGIAAKKANLDFNQTVMVYAKTSIAIFDAFIQCWDEKFRSNRVRPETVINQYIDRKWRPYLQTPPFPEYTCGHSTVSSAAAEVLTSVFGDGFAYTDSSEREFGIADRSFSSFHQAALENNWARFYGGIHFHSSCVISTEYGKKVGELVNQRLQMLLPK
ncbi:MAG: vanadium-dependent haloperoxidase [Bacteroidetes bacterium]|nr:vanadium-dependent haloperoxidase [Bacteroidota bacterium]